jgi:hypothetical protein
MNNTRKESEKPTPRRRQDIGPPRDKPPLAETVGRMLTVGVLRLLRAKRAEKKAAAEARALAEKEAKSKRKNKRPLVSRLRA